MDDCKHWRCIEDSEYCSANGRQCSCSGRLAECNSPMDYEEAKILRGISSAKVGAFILWCMGMVNGKF